MSNILVTYFSASGVTKRVAEEIANAVNGDRYEIRPEAQYTKKDLNWINPLSRSTREMHKKKFRPAIADKNANVEMYDIVLIGFPIWWGIAPTIINTFLESYDFYGKTIGLFATSGGSRFGKTINNLSGSVSDSVKWADPKLLNNNVSEYEMKNWIKEMK